MGGYLGSHSMDGMWAGLVSLGLVFIGAVAAATYQARRARQRQEDRDAD